MDKNFEDITLQELVRSILWKIVSNNRQRKIQFDKLELVSAIGKAVKKNEKIRKIFSKFGIFFEEIVDQYYSSELSQQIENIQGLVFYIHGQYFVDDSQNYNKVKNFFVVNNNLEIFEEIVEKTKKILL